MKNTVPIFFATGMLFIILGSFIYVKSNEIVDVDFVYSDECRTVGEACDVTFEVTDEMKSPVYFYINLTNFYQNHRLYMKSKSVLQLANEEFDSEICKPAITNAEMGKTVSHTGVELDP